MSSLAQEESRSISENTTWGQRKWFADGKVVVDMWLTGFDVPSMATMYVYKPMSGHNLMQAIARVNRVWKLLLVQIYKGRKR